MVKKGKSTWKSFKNTILIILGIAFIVVLVIFYFYYKEPKVEADELEEKKTRLFELENKIRILNPIKEQIERTEKRYLFFARILVSSVLVFFNLLFYNFDLSQFDLGDTLNFNGAILLGYGFVGYISHGTIDNFTKALKSLLARFLRKRHVNSLEELEILIKERDVLILEIQSFEDQKNKTENTQPSSK